MNVQKRVEPTPFDKHPLRDTLVSAHAIGCRCLNTKCPTRLNAFDVAANAFLKEDALSHYQKDIAMLREELFDQTTID